MFRWIGNIVVDVLDAMRESRVGVERWGHDELESFDAGCRVGSVLEESSRSEARVVE